MYIDYNYVDYVDFIEYEEYERNVDTFLKFGITSLSTHFMSHKEGEYQPLSLHGLTKISPCSHMSIVIHSVCSPSSIVYSLFIRFGLNVALTHQNRLYRDSETKENVEAQ